MRESFAAYFLLSLFSFLRHFWGIIVHPYQTYRELSKGKYPLEAFFILVLIFIYAALSSLLRKGLKSGPLLLTLRFNKIILGILFTFVIVWGILYFAGCLFGGKGKPRNLFLPWVYSLIPTLFWFLITSLFYFFLPPPRSLSLTGKIFTAFFLALSLTLFYWKGMLYYLTLRFGHKLDLVKIIFVSLVVFPLGVAFSLFTYKLGLFRIPFI